MLDLTSTKYQNDQLSCIYPTGRQFQFRSEEKDKLQIKIDGEPVDLANDGALSGDVVSVTVRSTSGIGGLLASVTYSLADGKRALQISTTVRNQSDKPTVYELRDLVRADKTFESGSAFDEQAMWIADTSFRQAYATVAKGFTVDVSSTRGYTTRFLSDADSEKKSSDKETDGDKTDEGTHGKPSFEKEIAAGESLQFNRRVFVAANQLSVLAAAGRHLGVQLSKLELSVRDEDGPVKGADITLKSNSQKLTANTNGKGMLTGALAPGEYALEIKSIGRPSVTEELDVDAAAKLTVMLERPGIVKALIVGEDGKQIPCKVAFFGIDDTKDPNFGNDSLATAMKNLRYSMGRFQQRLLPGKYDVLISRGPEYDVESANIEVKAGEKTELAATLHRVVDTADYVSAEYHSHSSPSGDNTSDQFGRVQNLLAEHLEFAPCTEHNRVDSYVPHLKKLKAEKWMATCCGMELTGSLLPVNHQNTFPLIHKPHTQDGGGPATDDDPVVQIERLAMWDDGSDKLMQTNHPNVAQIYGDRDTDGVADEGFRDMLSFMDVMEVHPINRIFDVPADGKDHGPRGNTILNWMQLLNLGYRIPGVVNTDAHYNFHGSGGLRNFVKSETDDPTKIDTMEMVHASRRGNLVMSTGPFMTVDFMSSHGDQVSSGISGDDVKAFNGKGILHVRVQCPNWLDINRVQVFVNGRAAPELNIRRGENPEKFDDGVLKFDQLIPVTLKEDSHLIVAAIGERMKLGRVMGPNWGSKAPIAVSNPIFADIDANGFKPNGDLLDAELPGADKRADHHGHSH